MFTCPTIRRLMTPAVVLMLAFQTSSGEPAGDSDQQVKVDLMSVQTVTSDFLETYCVDCHGETKPKGKFRLDDLIDRPFDPAENKRWLKILEMVETSEMPPPKKTQPSHDERGAFKVALDQTLKAFNLGKSDWELELPRYANRVNHEALFSGEHKGPAFTKSRVWRMSGDTYQRLMKDFGLGFDFVVPMKKNDTGFEDYSSLYADEATILTMKTNAKRVATVMVKGTPAKPRRGNQEFKPVERKFSGPKHREIQEFLAIEGEPTRAELQKIFRFVFQFLTKLNPDDKKIELWINEILAPGIAAGGLQQGLHATIVSILLSPDFLFRVEIGQGKELPDGRRMLSPTELAFALSYTLHNHPVDDLLKAAGEGRLETREDVEREFRKLYDDPRLLRGRVAVNSRDFVWMQSKDHRRGTYSRPKLVQFFQQYFGYTKATDVFKDDVRHGGKHDPGKLIKDADWTVLHVLARDQKVLEELLTTNHFAVTAGNRKKNKKTGEVPPPSIHGYQEAYNMTKAAEKAQGLARFELPKEQRAGMLTHPAWLVAHSQNFHTDPVRRGKWILGHLLGYDVPELPIAAQAQLPEWHDKTIRERFAVVEDEACWRCHKRMNPLGNPFEAFDDFGRYRKKHLVDPSGDLVEAEFEKLNRRNPDKGARAAEFVIPVDTTGELFGTGDSELDGPVKGPVELMQRLARSERVRQVFLRHVFRYFLGRNETLNDSPTLIAMDQAYLTSNGSFRETLVALVTSDSFIMRNKP